MIKKSYRYIIDISRKAPCRAWAFLEEKKKYIFVKFSFGYSVKDGFQAFPFGDKVLTTLSPFISGSFYSDTCVRPERWFIRTSEA